MNISTTIATLTVAILVCFDSVGNAQVKIPKEMEGHLESVSVNGTLIGGIGDWLALEGLTKNGYNDEKLTRCRLYGFGKINRGKILDVTITDAKSLELLRLSIHVTSCVRPIVPDLGIGDAATDGDFLGVMLLESKDSKCVVGVSFNGFSCGTADASLKTVFYSWPLASILGDLLKKNGCQLDKDIFATLSGQRAMKRAKSVYLKRLNKEEKSGKSSK